MTGSSPCERAQDNGTELTGQIIRVTYTNPDNGYSVLRLAVKGYPEPVTAVGNVLSPAAGETLLLRGGWTKHPKFGAQFAIESYENVIPATAAALEKYLASGLIKGVGPAMAEKIVARFGEETFAILDGCCGRLTEINGIGPKKAEMICASWTEQREIRELMLFLQNFGIGPGFAIRAFRQYGTAAVQVLTENPYRLAVDIFGIGFLTADKIAASMGFTSDSPLRIRAGVLHVMNSLVAEGHVFVPLEKLTETVAEMLGVSKERAEEGIEAARLAEEIIMEWYGEGEEDGDNCAVYLPAFHYAEKHSAVNLLELASSPFNGQYVDPETAIPWVQQELGIEFADLQRDALRTALRSQVMVITGGPGTGKTTLIRAILKIRGARGYEVMLAAPTGRAAKRMTEATGHEAKTIHRMLEYMGKSATGGDFMRNETNPLNCDLLIVDEASMIDQILFHHLLKAIPKGASLILVGDVDQLPSVGPGNVLREVIDSGMFPVVKLNEIFRQAAESSIIVNAHRVNSGEMPVFDTDHTSGLKDMYFIEEDDPERALQIIKRLVTVNIPQRFGFDPVNGIQVLAPMHRGSVGTARLNAELQSVLNTGNGAKIQRLGRTLQEGDKVMQIKNNYDKDVYNGDIGTIKRIDAEETRVTVEMDNGAVSYDFTELDELVHAYAVSIHKSQGSEYPAVVIPVMSQHYVMLQRNLLYTGITRGKKLAVLVGTKKALAIAVRNDKTRKRWTRLAERLKAGK